MVLKTVDLTGINFSGDFAYVGNYLLYIHLKNYSSSQKKKRFMYNKHSTVGCIAYL